MRWPDTTDIDLTNDPIGTGKDGQPVYLKDIWPTSAGNQARPCTTSLTPEMFREQYGNVWDGNETWNEIPVSGGEIYEWNARFDLHSGTALLYGR